jgi:hypothetical protein
VKYPAFSFISVNEPPVSGLFLNRQTHKSKTDMKTIFKGVLNIALFLAGMLAVCFLLGEPTPETNQQLDMLFGAFAGVAIILSKVLTIGVIYVIVMIAASINPSFKKELEAKEEA